MAQHLIEDFLESILNPEGRFRTLRDICAETDSRGCPLFSVGQREVVLRAVLGERPIRLTVLRKYTAKERETIAERAVDTLMGRPYLAECRYLPDEMAVYGSAGKIERFDVLVQPAFDNITDFVRKNSARSKLKSIRRALESVADAAVAFDHEGIVHGAMTIDNLCLDNECRLSAADYPLSLHHHEKMNDNDIFLTVGIMLYLSGCEPVLYRSLGAHGRFSEQHTDINRRLVVSAAEFYGMDTLVKALKQKDNDCARDSVNRRLAELAAEPFRPMPLLCEMVEEMAENKIGFTAIHRLPLEEDDTLNIDFSTCQEVGKISDTLVRYKKGDYWGYADRHGRRLNIDKPLIGACDFYENRAVVHTEEGYGLIDRTGRWVMDDCWNDMIWYGEANTVAACDRVGKWRLFNRCGEQISEVVCDSLSDCCEGVIVARQGNKYGFIAVDGRRVTDFLYDEAYGFTGGTALVAIGNRRYRIDRNGHGLSERESELRME